MKVLCPFLSSLLFFYFYFFNLSDEYVEARLVNVEWTQSTCFARSHSIAAFILVQVHLLGIFSWISPLIMEACVLINYTLSFKSSRISWNFGFQELSSLKGFSVWQWAFEIITNQQTSVEEGRKYYLSGEHTMLLFQSLFATSFIRRISNWKVTFVNHRSN